jgi:hypothetical protein
MPDLPALEHLLNTYGIPLAMLVAFGILVARGTLRWGTGVDATQKSERADRDAEMAFREQLRQEERKARLEAEQRLEEALEVAKAAGDLAASYERLVRKRIAPDG